MSVVRKKSYSIHNKESLLFLFYHADLEINCTGKIFLGRKIYQLNR